MRNLKMIVFITVVVFVMKVFIGDFLYGDDHKEKSIGHSRIPASISSYPWCKKNQWTFTYRKGGLMQKIQIYTLITCPYCIRAKDLLKERGLSFTEHVLDYNDDEAWEALEQRTGMDTVPQIFFGEKFIGGCSDLEDLDDKDGLESLRA